MTARYITLAVKVEHIEGKAQNWDDVADELRAQIEEDGQGVWIEDTEYQVTEVRFLSIDKRWPGEPPQTPPAFRNAWGRS